MVFAPSLDELGHTGALRLPLPATSTDGDHLMEKLLEHHQVQNRTTALRHLQRPFVHFKRDPVVLAEAVEGVGRVDHVLPLRSIQIRLGGVVSGEVAQAQIVVLVPPVDQEVGTPLYREVNNGPVDAPSDVRG